MLFLLPLLCGLVGAASTTTPTTTKSTATPTKSPMPSEYESKPTASPSNATKSPTPIPSTSPVIINDWPMTSFHRVDRNGIDLKGKPGKTLWDVCNDVAAGYAMTCQSCNSASYDSQDANGCMYNIVDNNTHGGPWASTWTCFWNGTIAVAGPQVQTIYNNANYLFPHVQSQCNGLVLSETGNCPWSSLCTFSYSKSSSTAQLSSDPFIQCSSKFPCPQADPNRGYTNAPTTSLAASGQAPPSAVGAQLAAGSIAAIVVCLVAAFIVGLFVVRFGQDHCKKRTAMQEAHSGQDVLINAPGRGSTRMMQSNDGREMTAV